MPRELSEADESDLPIEGDRKALHIVHGRSVVAIANGKSAEENMVAILKADSLLDE